MTRIVLTALTAVITAAAAPALAGVMGKWQPYSDPVQYLGTMTLSQGGVRFANGDRASMAGTASRNVYLLGGTKGEFFHSCGNQPVGYIGFAELQNGLLAVLIYRAGPVPPAPRGSTVLDLARDPTACSVQMFSPH